MARCIIVDDEPLSRDILRRYIADIRDLDLVAECPDGFDAIQQLKAKEVDIIFLDINMPGLSGISLVRSLTRSPLIIFTTAYPQFAVEGFELDALDYLVKPYSFERFLVAVNRAMERLSTENENERPGRKIIVKADKKLYGLDPDSILFIEGQGDYIRIHTEEMKLMVHDTIKNFIESLPDEKFMRVHKSWVVNLEKISFIEGNHVRISSDQIPVSPSYRENLMNRFSAS